MRGARPSLALGRARSPSAPHARGEGRAPSRPHTQTLPSAEGGIGNGEEGKRGMKGVKKYGGILLLLAAAVSVAVAFRNGLVGPYDFQWSTAKALLAGTDPYAAKSGGDAYACYVPSCLLLLAPWTLLGRESALVAWLVANVFFMLGFLALMCRMFVGEGCRLRMFAWLSLLMFVSLPFRQLIECGQHIGFSLFFFALALFCHRRGNWPLAGLCLIPALFKYTTTIPLCCLFLVLGAWRALGIAALGHLLLTLVASLLTRTAPWTLIAGSMRIGAANAGRGVADPASLLVGLGLPGASVAAIVGYALGALALAGIVLVWRRRKMEPEDELRVLTLLALISSLMFYHRLYDFVVLMIVPFLWPRLTTCGKVLAGATLAWFFVGYRVYVLFAPPETAVAFGLISLLSLLLALIGRDGRLQK